MDFAKNSSFVISGGQIVQEQCILTNGFLAVENGTIRAIGAAAELPPELAAVPRLELAADSIVLPGFIDMHIHGANGADVMDATPEALATLVHTLPQEGTTSFLATTITQSRDAIASAVSGVARFMVSSYVGAEILGIHLEGPFINPKLAGAQPPEQIVPPSVAQFDEYQRLADGTIRLVTLAPETEGGLELIAHLHAQGVIASLGHSNATAAEVREAVAQGLTHATHLYNAMKAMHHREAGAVGAILLEDRITAEMIFDTVHVCPEMVQLALRLKGTERMVMITDAMRAKCLKNGTYDLGGQAVVVQDGEARLPDGTLAGSVLKMNRAAAHLAGLTGCSLPEIAQLTATNAAKELGVADRKGSLAVGKEADIVVLNANFDVLHTFCRGALCYSV